MLNIKNKINKKIHKNRDLMDKLYAPWRREYHTKKQEGCVFCDIASSPEKACE